MLGRTEERRLAWVLFIAGGLWALWLAQHFPAASDYRMAADEGTYFRQASVLGQQGLGGFRTLCEGYVGNVAERTAPPPFRIMHLTLAALVVKLWPSVVALSWLSLCFHLANVALMFALGKRLWGARTASLASALLLVSPLASGAAVRALADTHVLLSTTTALLCCACWLAEGKRRDFRAFVAVLAYALLLKETSYLLLPFFVLALLIVHRRDPQRVSRADLVALLAVPFGCLLLTSLLLGAEPFYQAVQIAFGFNAQEPHAYLAAFGAGPWYEYLVDFTLLSPCVSVLALGFAGQLALQRRWRAESALFALFAPYFLLIFAALPKNPRFALPLDPVLRLGAVALVERLVARHVPLARFRPIALTAALVLLIALDARGFRHFFVESAIYDPVAYNLLAAERMIPVPDSALSSAQRLKNLERRAQSERTPANYLALSLAHYEAKNYAGALTASIAAIELQPNFAPAYNNLGLAQAGLGHFDKAIDAFEVAVRLAPDFQLAKNNLAWAREQSARAKP